MPKYELLKEDESEVDRVTARVALVVALVAVAFSVLTVVVIIQMTGS